MTVELEDPDPAVLNGVTSLTALDESFAAQRAFEPVTRRAPDINHPHRARTVRIGLLGLGHVGQAVARLAASALPTFMRRGLRPIVGSALVRDASKPRDRGPNEFSLTDDPDAFFHQRFDIIIETLGGIEPARSYVERALSAGIPVVTANKSVMAAHGPALADLARRRGTKLACEASAVAGIPFLTLMNRRPCCGDITRVAGILNGTSNFILSRVALTRCTLDAALHEAQRRGFAEPDPALDLSGRDAAEKLIVILHHMGIRGVCPGDLEVHGIHDIGPADLARAATLGGTIKPVACAEIDQDSITAFVGPVFVARGNPLHDVDGVENAICLSGPRVGPLIFRGPGAGPDITAATLLDDVAELVVARNSDGFHFDAMLTEIAASRRVVAPRTCWFLRCIVPNETPFPHVADCLKAQGVETAGLAGGPSGQAERSVYLTTGSASRLDMEAAVRVLCEKLHCTVLPLRMLPS